MVIKVEAREVATKMGLCQVIGAEATRRSGFGMENLHGRAD